MEALKRTVLLCFECIVSLLLSLLLFRHLSILTVHDLFHCERTLDETQDIARDNLLYLERQVLLDEVVCRPHNTKVIIRGKPDRLDLIDQVLPRRPELFLFNLLVAKLQDFKWVFCTSLVYVLDELLRLFQRCVEVSDLALGDGDLRLETGQLIVESEA